MKRFIECPSKQSDICCLVVRFLLQVRRRRPYSNPKVQRNWAKTQTPQTPQALPTREFCWICLDELVAGDGSYPGGWPWQGHQHPWYSSSHVFTNFESTNLFNWGGIKPRRTPDKEVKPNPLVLAWLTNALTSTLNLVQSTSTDPLG